MILGWLADREAKKRGCRRVVIGRRFWLFGGDVYIIRPVTSLDVIKSREGLPLCYLKITEGHAGGKGMYEQAQTATAKEAEADKKKEKKAVAKMIRFFLRHGVVSKNGAPFDADSLFLIGFDEPQSKKIMREILTAQVLFLNVLGLSFKLFSDVIEVTRDDMTSIYNVAKMYGQRPIQILANGRDHTDLEAYMVDYFVSSIGIKHENEQYKKAESEARNRGRARR